MSGFDDLIPAAMPYMATADVEGTIGGSWEWGYVIKDNDSALVDMTTGYTGVARIRTAPGGALIETPVVDFPAEGEVVCTLTAAETALLVAGVYQWELQVTRDVDDVTVTLVGGGDSRFTIKPSTNA